MLKDWKKAKSRKVGDNISIIYVKENISLELFRDALWHNQNMNVIIRDKEQKSLESNLGKEILVKYFKSKSEAKEFANQYMRLH